MASIRAGWIKVFYLAAALITTFRAVVAISDLIQGEVTAFLAFPLTVILPAAAFIFIARQRDMASQEGALMQLGVMIQLLLILALPGVALYLALGFPVVFLVVELFETRFPVAIRDAIKKQVLA